MATMEFNSYKEYILFLYVHIAFADGVLQPEEKDLIFNKLEKYFGSREEIESSFNKMVEDYHNNTEPIENIIRKTITNYSNVEFYKKYKIFKDLYDIIEADGVVSVDETRALEKLQEVIGFEMEI